MTLFPSTLAGKASSPRVVVCAHGFRPISRRTVSAKQSLHLCRGKCLQTSSIVEGWTRSAWVPVLSVSHPIAIC